MATTTALSPDVRAALDIVDASLNAELDEGSRNHVKERLLHMIARLDSRPPPPPYTAAQAENDELMRGPIVMRIMSRNGKT